ncbi:MAG TPA: hypothetical protein VEL74_01930 [Thermoanaerobaculia bacterium]|nr:hypothetical protein [Thermoanaerobaculia bacterium]
MNHKTAEHIISVSMSCINRLDRSVEDAIDAAPEEHASSYRSLAGEVMGYLFTEVLMPIYAAHPDLEPEELREARVSSQPTSMPPEIAAKLMNVCTSVSQSLRDLCEEVALSPRETDFELESALQEPLKALRHTQEFLRRACPDLEPG